jgi:F0F1-type ATP synthase membrane subunit b/b'
MSEGTPIQSALDAEREAREAVDEARVRAREIRQAARDRARQIEQRAQDRIQRLQSRLDASLESSREQIESRGAEALKKLHREAVDENVMTGTIEALVKRIMEDER